MLRALCRFCGDVPIAAEAAVVVVCNRPALWRCCFVCPQCHRPMEMSVVESAGLVLISGGAYVLEPERSVSREAVCARTTLDLDDVENFRQVLSTDGLLETLADQLPD